MDKYEIVSRIEKFAPLETAEKWDCSGWIVETAAKEVNRIMLALTVTQNVVQQAKSANCNMIISHHPLFEVPIEFKDINIYCAHTNMDIAQGGTTDTFIEKLMRYGLSAKNIVKDESFVRYVETEISLQDLMNILSKVSPSFRYAHTDKIKKFRKIAFCAGSGSEFIQEAYMNDADGFVTGDLKFHTTLDSPIAVFDVGHFESEIQVLDVFAGLIGADATVVKAIEESPFKTYK